VLCDHRIGLAEAAAQLSLSLAGTWRSQLIVFLYQDCEMDIAIGTKSRSITKAHCFAIDEAFHHRKIIQSIYPKAHDG